MDKRQQSGPACEKLTDARELLPSHLPFALGPATPMEMKLEASLSTKRTQDDAAESADLVSEESDSDSDDDEDSDAEEDGDNQDGSGKEEATIF